MSTSHARPGILARFAARFADDPSQPRIARIGIPGMTEWATVAVPPAPGPQERHATEQHPPWEYETRQAPTPGETPVHMAADEYGIFPCCGQHETQVPGWQADDPRLVTCRRSAHDTMPDERGPMDRPFAPVNDPEPEPEAHAYKPDLYADIRDLPILRAAIEVAARRQHVGCDCLPEDKADRAEWYADQYAHITERTWAA